MTLTRNPKPWAWEEIIRPAWEYELQGQYFEWHGLLKEVERRIELLTTLKKRRGKKK